jgi:hypothetical protein
VSKETNAHIEANLEVIRLYLIGQFKGFDLTDTSSYPFSHTNEISKGTVPGKGGVETSCG